MKENTTATSDTSESGMMSTQELTITLNSSRLQRQPIQLACKENIMEQSDGLGIPAHSTSTVLRPRRQQQQQLQMYGFQPAHLEVNAECLSESVGESLAIKNPNPLTSDLRGHQSHFLSLSHTHVRTRPQQACKLRISQLMSCDMPDTTNSSPLPHLQWARSATLWRTMRSKDVSKVAPEAELRLRHPEILSSMRIILLDWMMEVYLIL